MAAFSLRRGALAASLLPVLASALLACGPADESLGTAEEASTVCADGPTVKGVDVSYYQGTIDWPAVEKSGRAFAFARVNDGDFIDPKFTANWKGMKAAGLL